MRMNRWVNTSPDLGKLRVPGETDGVDYFLTHSLGNNLPGEGDVQGTKVRPWPHELPRGAVVTNSTAPPRRSPGEI